MLVVVVVATSLAGLVTTWTAGAAGCSAGTVACDSFARTVSNGWGTADVGGAWSTTGPSYSVSNGSGSIMADSTSPTNFLTSVSVRDVDIRVLVTPPGMSNQVNDDGVAVRYRSSTSSWYQVNAYSATSLNAGHYTVQLKRKPDNALIRPEYQTSIKGGTPYWLRLQAQGVSPTILRWKIWTSGTKEPSSWNDVGADSIPAEQVAGGVGVIAYAGSGTSTVRFSGLTATRVSATTQLVSCPTSVTACDSYNRTMSNGWGTANVGGAWSGSGAAFAVHPGKATIAADATAPSSFLGSVSMQDVDVRAKVSPPPANSTQVVGAAIAVREAAGSWYQLSTYDTTQVNGGNDVVQLTRKPDNAAVLPDFSTSLAAGIPYWIRLQAVGVNPTTLRWKIWADGTAEPSTWAATAVDGNAAQQRPGAVGVVAYASSATSTVTFNSFQASVPTPTTPRVIPCPSAPIACDRFNRTMSGGWGTADAGGAWSTSGAQYGVTPGDATIVADSTTPSNFLAGVSAQDVDLLTMITPPPLNSSQYVSIGVDVRYIGASASWYQVAAYYNSANNNGNYTVQLTSKPSNAAIRPDYQTNVPGGAPFWLRVEAQGVGPTTLRWKLWADGATEPRGWTDSGLDSTAALQSPGGVGIAAYASSGSAPVSFNSVQAVAVPATPPAIIPCPTSPMACDSFARTVGGGWGTADIGGAWTASGGAYSVSPGGGTIIADASAPTATLASLSVQDADVLALIAPPPIDSSQYQDDGVVVRYAAGGTWYQVNAFYNNASNGGDYTVQLKRKPDDALIRPAYQTGIPGGTPYWMRLEAQGVNPTMLLWKMWPQGQSEPAAWNDSGTDSTAAEQAAGSAGVIAYADNGQSTVRFESVQVNATGSAPPPPPTSTSCPASPVACDTFNRSVSAAWGSADTGGGWSITGTPTRWSVSPGAGVVGVTASGTQLGVLGSVSVRDVEIVERVVLPRSTQANDDVSFVLARYAGGGTPTYYRVGVGQGTGSRMILRAQRADGTPLTGDTATGIPSADGTPVWLRVQVQGAYPTAIRARAWADGSAEPTRMWMIDTTDSDAAEQVAGSVGVRDRNEDTSATHTFQHNAYQVVAMAPPGSLCPAGALACDTFQRSVANGWGSADVGGAWSATGSIYSVTPGAATLTVDSTAPANFLPAVSGQDVDARIWLAMPSIGATGDAGIAVRYQASGGTYYQVSVYYPSGVNGGNYVVQLKRKPENVLINPDFSTSIPGGTAIWIRLQAQGVNPTTLRWKIWQDGVPEPAGWTATGTDSNPAEQGPGGVGVEGFISSGTAPMVFNALSAGPITS